MTPATIRVAFDSGWTIGDPGDGRLRFDSPKLAKAAFVMINARCAQETLLDAFVTQWKIGDVLVIERTGAETNRVVAWVIGAIHHCGPFYRVPIAIRTVYGGFAAHDELIVTHHTNVIDTGAADPDIAPLPRVTTQEPAPVMRVTAAPFVPLLAPMAPVTVAASPPTGPFESEPASPMAPTDSDLSRLEAENQALKAFLDTLLSDKTPLYVVEGHGS